MAWTYFPLSYGTLPANGLQEFDIWQELIDAINERDLATGGAGFSNPFTNVTAAGTAVAQASKLNAMQTKIEALVPKFAVHTNSGGAWNGQVSIPAWAWTNNATNGILNVAHGDIGSGNGWTRRHGSDPDALSTSYGRVTAGDVVGLYREGGVDKISEFLNEMYRVLDLLRWSKVTPSAHSREKIDYQTTVGEATAALAYARLVAEWSGVFVAGNILSAPGRFSSISGPGVYLARGVNQRQGYTVTGITTAFSHSMDVYAAASSVSPFGTPYEFDSDGLGYVSGLIALLESFAEAASSSRSTAVFGNDNTVQDAHSGGDVGSRGYDLRGFMGTSTVLPVAILKWDGPSGFTKVS